MSRSIVIAMLVVATLPVSVEAAAWANGLFLQRTHDYGPIPRGEKRSYDFIITNNTRRDVRIKSVRVSCSCTKAVAASGRLEPGQSTFLTCTMDTAGFQGSKTVTVYVRFDRPWRAEVPLRITCQSVGKLGEEATEVDFGILSAGAAPQKRINLDYEGPLDWQVTDLDFGNPSFSTEIREVRREPGKVGYELSIRLLPDAEAGIHEDTIRVHTNDPKTPIVVVKAKAQIESDVVVTPASIHLGTLKPGESIERKLMIKAANPFKVVGLDNGEGMLHYKSGATPKSVQLVVLTFTAPQTNGDIPEHVDIVTDIDGERVVSVDLEK